MAQQQATPPLLLTKRLTSFLATRLSPTSATSLLLTTPTGNLLAHASRPAKSAAELRAQATVASSLVAMHGGCATHLVPNALSASLSPRGGDAVFSSSSSYDDDANADASSDASSDNGDGDNQPRRRGQQTGVAEGEGPCAVTVQLSAGVVVIRRLACGLLLVCVGPSERGGGAGDDGASLAAGEPGGNSSVVGSPDEGDSIVSGGASSVASGGSVRAQGVLLVRRTAEEVARALDEKLGRLKAPLDTVGAE
ncbi:hypothetical protein jhhlp_003306 [Lomentospora prolificans]|uniref:Uncharacterized protein n=1 Tax=Lomentospora prolificans TaxID=41688 RepID=A0A2N3NGL4_9PEZI|nr:hypothetical protein jhhlp_003306 [Lomentospora prolificans]